MINTKTMPYHFTISKFAELTHLTPRALRLYEREGLLVPAVINKETGYRYYHQDQVAKAEQIRLLRNLEMSLSSIKDVLAQKNAVTRATLLGQHEARMREKMELYEESLSRLHVLYKQESRTYRAKSEP